MAVIPSFCLRARLTVLLKFQLNIFLFLATRTPKIPKIPATQYLCALIIVFIIIIIMIARQRTHEPPGVLGDSNKGAWETCGGNWGKSAELWISQ